jgi:hypothetical protein
MKHIKLNTINVKTHPELDEKWVHDVIASDPSLLHLGDVVVKDRERIHPGAGRLDMLLQDADGHGRYEVEIQLGATDPSHIIRTLEYWDTERKRFPQYDHTAVIVAEDITSRFLNVIGLFNGAIPVMAIQMSAVAIDGGAALLFTKVLDTLQLGFVDDDEDVNEPADRVYWENRGSIKTVKLADQVLELCQDFASEVQLNFNRHYIGFYVDGKVCNFAVSRPRKSHIQISVKLPQSEEIDNELDQQDLDLLDYDKRSKAYSIRLNSSAISKHGELLKGLLKRAFDLRNDS